MDQQRTPAPASPLPTAVDHLTGETIVRLMRAHGWSIRGLAECAGLTQKRVREVRARGVRGLAYVYDWATLITGSACIHWSDVADLYVRGMRRKMPRPGRATQRRSDGGRAERADGRQWGAARSDVGQVDVRAGLQGLFPVDVRTPHRHAGGRP